MNWDFLSQECSPSPNKRKLTESDEAQYNRLQEIYKCAMENMSYAAAPNDEHVHRSITQLQQILNHPLIMNNDIQSYRKLKILALRNLSRLFEGNGNIKNALLLAIEAFSNDPTHFSTALSILKLGSRLKDNWTLQMALNNNKFSLEDKNTFLYKQILRYAREIRIGDNCENIHSNRSNGVESILKFCDESTSALVEKLLDLLLTSKLSENKLIELKKFFEVNSCKDMEVDGSRKIPITVSFVEEDRCPRLPLIHRNEDAFPANSEKTDIFGKYGKAINDEPDGSSGYKGTESVSSVSGTQDMISSSTSQDAIRRSTRMRFPVTTFSQESSDRDRASSDTNTGTACNDGTRSKASADRDPTGPVAGDGGRYATALRSLV